MTYNRPQFHQINLIPCISGLFYRRGCVLLVKRARAPRKGEWSLPGGKVQCQETYEGALRREMLEECHLHIHSATQYASLRIANTYDLRCFRIWDWSGRPFAGDDATSLIWVPIRKLKRFIRLDTYRTIQTGLKAQQGRPKRF